VTGSREACQSERIRWLGAFSLLLSGCTAPPPDGPETWLQPNYAALPDACFTPEFADWMLLQQAPDGSRGHPTWSDPCVDALATDIGLDRTTCAESTDPDAETGGCSAELVGLYLFTWLDFGSVDEIDQGTTDYHASYVRRPFIDAVRMTADMNGHERVGPALYDMVTSTIETTEVGSDLMANPDHASAAIRMETRQLLVLDTTPTREGMVWMYMHEMAHPWTGTNHVDCEEFIALDAYGQILPGWTECDADFNGPHGFVAGALSLAYEYGPADHEVDTDDLGGEAVWARCLILGEPCPDEPIPQP